MKSGARWQFCRTTHPPDDDDYDDDVGVEQLSYNDYQSSPTARHRGGDKLLSDRALTLTQRLFLQSVFLISTFDIDFDPTIISCIVILNSIFYIDLDPRTMFALCPSSALPWQACQSLSEGRLRKELFVKEKTFIKTC